MCLCISGYAYDVFTTVESADGSVKRFLNISADDINAENVNVEIINAGKTLEDICAGNEREVLGHVKTLAADENGRVFYKFRMTGESGEYTVRIKEQGKSDIFETTVKTVSDEETEKFFEELKNVNDKSGMQSLITKSEAFLDMLHDADIRDINAVCEALAGDLPYTDAERFSEKYKEAVIIDEIRSLNTVSELKEALEIYKNIVGAAESPVYDLYSENEEKVLKDMLNGKYIDKKTFMECLNEKSVICAMESAQSPAQAYEILKNDYLKTDFKTYDKLRNKAAATSAVKGKRFGDIKSMLNAFYDAAEAQRRAETDSSAGGSASSGKGGGGGSVVKSDAAVNIPMPAQTKTETIIFKDLGDAIWARESIAYLADKKIINGYENGNFEPNKNITREEFAKMCVTAFGIGSGNKNAEFTDVDKNAWYGRYVGILGSAGIVNGYEDGSFGVGRDITREEAAVTINRILNASEKDYEQIETADFKDEDDIDEYAKQSVNELKKRGIVCGNSDNMFLPHNCLTRAECAQMIYGALKNGGVN